MPQTFERRGTTVPLSVSSFNHTRVRELIDGDERLLEAVIPNYSGVRRGEFTVLAWDDLKTLATFSERDTYIMEKVSKSRSHKDIDPIKLRMICQQADAIYQPDAHIRRLAREQAQRDREDRDMVRLSCLAQLTRECGIARGDAFMAKASSKTLMDLMTGDGDEWLRVGSMKLFADGSAGGKTAAMSSPYADDADNRGIFIYGDEELHGMIADYHARGFQIATHAIGDAAIEQVLSGYERAMGNTVDTQRRHRIEHCGFLTQDQLDGMARIGVLPAPQPIFLYEFGDLYVDALGHGRPEAKTL